MAISSNQRASRRPSRLAVVGLILTLLSPLTVFVAVAGLKTGLLPIATAYDLLTMQLGFYLAGVGILGAILALVGGAMTVRTSWLFMVAAVVIAAATSSLLLREIGSAAGYGIANKMNRDFKPGAGVSTDSADPIGFPASIMAERSADGADALASGVGANGCEIAPLPMQSAPGAAGYALQQAGFDIRDLGVNRGTGVYTSVWFDRTYDAAIRIRPGRTDVRVAPRDGARDHGTSCRLAQKILTALQPSR